LPAEYASGLGSDEERPSNTLYFTVVVVSEGATSYQYTSDGPVRVPGAQSRLSVLMVVAPITDLPLGAIFVCVTKSMPSGLIRTTLTRSDVFPSASRWL
jgi:hypothetical protein